MEKVDNTDNCAAVLHNSGADTDRRLRGEDMTLDNIAIILGVILVISLIADWYWN